MEELDHAGLIRAGTPHAELLDARELLLHSLDVLWITTCARLRQRARPEEEGGHPWQSSVAIIRNQPESGAARRACLRATRPA